MQRHVARSGDPWGLESERDDEGASPVVERAGRAAPMSWRRATGRGVLVALVTAVAGFAIPVTVAASSSRPASVPHGVKAVRINGGERGALYSSIEPIAASSGGDIVVQEQRLGNGLLNPSSNRYFTVATGKTKLEAFSLPPKITPSFESVAGSMATIEYYETGYKVLYRNLATNKTGTVRVPSTESWHGSTPTGWLLSEPSGLKTKLLDYDAATKRSATLGSFSGISVMASGPGGAVVTASTGTSTKVEYVAYAPVKTTTLVVIASGQSYNCASVTTNAVGCTVYDAGKLSVTRLPLPKGRPVEFKVSARLGVLPVVTPRATGWLECGTGRTCTLERQKSSGGKPAALTIPRVMGGILGLASSADNFLFGRLENSSPAGGLFAFGDAATKPMHLVSAPASPIGACVVSLSSKTVAWADSSRTGIAIYQRSVKVSGGGVKFGSPKLLAQSGFVSTDSSSFGLSLSNAGTEVAYSTYRTQPTADPMGLDLDNNGRVRQISSDAAYSNFSQAYSPTVGPAVSIAGNFVLFQTETPSALLKFSLYDVSTAHICTLSTGNVDYALGNGPSAAELVYISKAGGVYEHTPSCSLGSPHEIAPPLASVGAAVDSVSGLGIAGDYVAWAYNWASNFSSGAVASWVNRTGGGIRNILDPKGIVALVLSTTDIGVTTVSNNVTELHGISLPTGAETILATDSYDLSVGDGVAAWINQSSSTPLAGKI